MNNYEIAVVIGANTEDDARLSTIQKIKDLVSRFEGSVIKVEEWGKRRLAYEIRKQNEAFYYFIHFETENPECPNELEKQLRIMDGLLRYLIVKEDECPADSQADEAPSVSAEAGATDDAAADEQPQGEAEEAASEDAQPETGEVSADAEAE